MTNGLVFGKFCPVHLGHEYLIETGMEYCDVLHVVVCSLSSEPIDGKLRFQWMKNRFAKEIESGKIKVYHMDDDSMPQEPTKETYRFFYTLWAAKMKWICQTYFDHVFASEEYVYPMSEFLGGSHPVLVDLERKTFPVSGTKCRTAPYDNWEYMNPDVKKHFTKKILITGGESTGKSTLTSLLAEHYRQKGISTIGIKELARDWIDEHLEGDMDRLEFDHITKFGKMQMSAVDHFVDRGEYQLVISDTDAIVSAIFQIEYFKNVSEELSEIVSNEKWDMALLLCPDVPWIYDGQRNLGDNNKRKKIFDYLQWMLEDYHIPHTIINGDFDKRFKDAVEAIDKVLGL